MYASSHHTLSLRLRPSRVSTYFFVGTKQGLFKRTSAQSQPRRRRHFSREFKANIVAACLEPGVSVSRIALDNQLNANLLRRWIREAEQAGQTTTIGRR